MAQQKWTVDITWENQVGFSVEAQKDSNPSITIVDIDENGHIQALWPKVSEVALEWFRHILIDIGKDMAQ